MSTVLYVVLGALVGVLLTPLLLWIAFKLFVRFFLKKLVAAFGDLGGAPVMRLEAIDHEEPDWKAGKLIERLSKELEKHGFQQAGDYTLLTMPTVDVRGMANPDRSFYAVIYDWKEGATPGLTTVVDLVAIEAEGERRDFTVSNAPETWLDEPPWTTKPKLDIDIKNPGVAIPALLDALGALVDWVDLQPASPEEFLATLKHSYNREMDWQIERGGLQREELARHLVKVQGLSEEDENFEAAIEAAQSPWEITIAEFIASETRERFLRRVTKMSAGEWEDTRDRVYVVHERSVPEILKAELANQAIHVEAIDEDDDDEAYERRHAELMEQLEEPFADASPRAAFAAAQALLPEGHRYKRLAKIKAPWPADVYLEPEYADA